MISYIKIFYESIIQAIGTLRGNKMRAFLSLLGITIGIFCIIAIKSAVDSLEKNILDGFQEFGNDVVYVSKMPWNEDPGKNYWKYVKRPDPRFVDYKMITQNSKLARMASYTVFTGGRTVKYKGRSVDQSFIMGTTPEYRDIFQNEITQGRYFTPLEFRLGTNKVILGHKVAEALFESLDAVGRNVKLFGQKYQVIGVLKYEGENMFNFINYDDAVWISYNNIRRFVSTKDGSRTGKLLNVKAKKGVSVRELKGELTSLLRRSRRLRPTEKDNFSLNEMSALANVIESLTKALNVAGFIIGIFSLIIGMFSVANIMFVSVKERTNQIGIKKAIGAKHYMILLEFLIESILLCVIGGVIGLAFVFGLFKLVTTVTSFKLDLSLTNVMIGILVSVTVGVLSGILPAWRASKLDPVVAMRG